MNIAKFEYWAKRKGMSCVRAKQGFDQKMYSNEDTELAYNCWLAALSDEVDELHEEQLVSEMVYKTLQIDNKYFVAAVDEIVDKLFTEEGGLTWLYKFSLPHETDNSHVLSLVRPFKNSCKKNVLELSKYVQLRDFTSWVTREDYTKNKSLINKAAIGVSSTGYRVHPLETTLSNKISNEIMLSRTTICGTERKFTDKVINLATELAEKDKNESN